ncbi:MAG: RNA degradosome polyphosphate kinase [Alphaproteobacteria bacterium]|nr:RNA degradosome polyphosphate kinase [Alphaproteobacteria bacterium]
MNIQEPLPQTKDYAPLKEQPERFLNRELCWLAFDERVLEEAQNPHHPLLERVRFLSICARNLDEFVMVRMAGLKAQIRAGMQERSVDGLTAAQQLEAVYRALGDLIPRMQNTWRDLRALLRENNIQILNYSALGEADRLWLEQHFIAHIMPILTPIALDPAHPFPFIPNKGLSLVVHTIDTLKNAERDVVIQIPQALSRFVRLPGQRQTYVHIERVIMRNLQHMFPMDIKVKNYATFRVIRDTELEVAEGAEDLMHTFENALKQRRHGNVITLGAYHTINPKTLDFLREKLGIGPHQVVKVDGLLGLADIREIISDERPDLLFPPFTPRFPERIRDFAGDCLAAIRQKDIIVHHPYESFDVVVQFLRQAARDPDVLAIKQTLYRTSLDSPIVNALIEAAEAGKSVTALVELKARFDEETNIELSRRMERAGVQVVYGFVHLKTHAKISLVVRREGQDLRSYAHFGTGNYHPQNARIYTDLSYFTLCREAGLVFNYITGYAVPQHLEKIAVAPLNLRQHLNTLIDREIANAQQGLPAAIWIKCNAVLDAQIIDKLYEASQAGVPVEIVVRGSCILRPGLSGLSENIHVKSILGRYLEHARVYAFANGGPMPGPQAKVLMGSADLMERNLDRRVEVLVPLENPTVHAQVLEQIMVANLKDKRQSWVMDATGHYTRQNADADDFAAHDYFMQNPSLSGRGKALVEAPLPPRLALEDK